MSTTELSLAGNRIIPAPYIGITKQFIRSQSNEIIGSTFLITLTGKLMAFSGSPNSSGVYFNQQNYPTDEQIGPEGRLSSLLRKQEALRLLFNADGKELILQGADGGPVLSAFPRIIGPIVFSEGPWFNYIDYSINLESDILYPMQEDTGLSGLHISDASETWELSTDDGTPEGIGLSRTYRLSHNVSAVGKRFFDVGGLTQAPWQNARDYVVPKLGFNSQFLTSSGVRDIDNNYNHYNHVRVENIDVQGGSYAVSETFMLASGVAIEDFTVEQSQSIEDGLINVNVQGNITGLEQRTTDMQLSVTKYTNANTKFTQVSGLVLGRAQNYTGVSLNIQPTSQTVGRNPIVGTISYQFSFNNRPSNLIPGSRSESISINENFHNNIIAEIPVLGRQLGPVLQPINTSQPLSRELSIEVVMSCADYGSGTLSNLQSAFFGQRPSAAVSGIINACDPTSFGYSQVYIQTNTEGWQPREGRYSRNISWVMEL